MRIISDSQFRFGQVDISEIESFDKIFGYWLGILLSENIKKKELQYFIIMESPESRLSKFLSHSFTMSCWRYIIIFSQRFSTV